MTSQLADALDPGSVSEDTTGTRLAVANWSGVFAMSLCVFAPIAADLHVTEGMARQ